MTIKEKISRILPEYAWLPLAVEVLLNMAVYNGAKLIAGRWYHYNLETGLDRAIPFVPWTVLIYFGCYLFWIMNYMISVRQGRKAAYRFLSADFLAKCICFFFFLSLPTTNIRPEVTGDGIWNALMRFLYWVDSADNLFPSIHCLTSWMCYIGVRGRKNVPFWYRSFSCLMAIAVFISTLTTKQHVVADVAGGVLLAEACYRITDSTGFGRLYGYFFEQMTGYVFRR